MKRACESGSPHLVITLLHSQFSYSGDSQVREIQFSTISDDGILASYSTYVHQEGDLSPTKISKGYGNTLQVYSADELRAILKDGGFIVLNQTDINGEEFSKENTERILTIAKKI